MTWAELVHECNNVISKAATKANTKYETDVCNELLKVQEKVFNMESLARIATALEKIAGMDTEVNTEDYLEEK